MKFVFALILTFLTLTSFAQILDIEAEFTVSSEYDDDQLEASAVKKEGWSLNMRGRETT